MTARTPQHETAQPASTISLTQKPSSFHIAFSPALFLHFLSYSRKTFQCYNRKATPQKEKENAPPPSTAPSPPSPRTPPPGSSTTPPSTLQPSTPSSTHSSWAARRTRRFLPCRLARTRLLGGRGEVWLFLRGMLASGRNGEVR